MQLAWSRTGQGNARPALYAARTGTPAVTLAIHTYLQVLACPQSRRAEAHARTHTPHHKELSTVRRQADPATRIGGNKALVPLELTLTARPCRRLAACSGKNAFFFCAVFQREDVCTTEDAITAGLLDGLGLGLPIPGTRVFGCGARIEIVRSLIHDGRLHQPNMSL